MPVRDGLLALLRRGPRHGYQLKSDFESATGGVWPLNVGQVYTTLDRLQRDGLVDATDGDGQREYRLTVDGRDALSEWWEGSTADGPPPRDDLMLKVLLAVEVDRQTALAVITAERTALYQRLQRHRRAQRSSRRTRLADALVADALVTRTVGELRWLDLCEQRLLTEGEQ